MERGFGVTVGEESAAALCFFVVADALGSVCQGGQAAQKAPVRLMGPRDRAVSLPAALAERVEPPVVADPGIGVALQVAPFGQGGLSEGGPGERRGGVGHGHGLRVAVIGEWLGGGVVRKQGGRRAAEEVVERHTAILPWHPG